MIYIKNVSKDNILAENEIIPAFKVKNYAENEGLKQAVDLLSEELKENPFELVKEKCTKYLDKMTCSGKYEVPDELNPLLQANQWQYNFIQLNRIKKIQQQRKLQTHMITLVVDLITDIVSAERLIESVFLYDRQYYLLDKAKNELLQSSIFEEFLNMLTVEGREGIEIIIKFECDVNRKSYKLNPHFHILLIGITQFNDLTPKQLSEISKKLLKEYFNIVERISKRNNLKAPSSWLKHNGLRLTYNLNYRSYIADTTKLIKNDSNDDTYSPYVLLENSKDRDLFGVYFRFMLDKQIWYTSNKYILGVYIDTFDEIEVVTSNADNGEFNNYKSKLEDEESTISREISSKIVNVKWIYNKTTKKYSYYFDYYFNYRSREKEIINFNLSAVIYHYRIGYCSKYPKWKYRNFKLFLLHVANLELWLTWYDFKDTLLEEDKDCFKKFKADPPPFMTYLLKEYDNFVENLRGYNIWELYYSDFSHDEYETKRIKLKCDPFLYLTPDELRAKFKKEGKHHD